MGKKVLIFTLLPLVFSFALFSVVDFNLGSISFVGVTLLAYFLFNLYLDSSNKSTNSRRLRGFSAYLGFLLCSIYLLSPAVLLLNGWMVIILWIVFFVLSYRYREILLSSILSNGKGNRGIRFIYWGSAIVVLLIGGGGYYPVTSRILNQYQGDSASIFLSSIYLFFSLWFLIFAQSSIAKFTTFKD
ncbi:hypothetical protein [Peribacillus alkalitolerans]|uniref:hypothetical protein n=1 Tax=Peribacillus alkalitolerans TaxID=1550385 RepID=UPI0013D3434A|nr:hypothetical protein [Peribacillus alkalitolerans]